MTKKTITILLFIIILIASVLRLWRLGDVPPSPDWDEVALGYNAYSIAQTGGDEYGNFLPFILRSFDDYKPAFYAYFIIPFIKIFDLSVISVRFPSAFFGVLTVLATYFLVKELFSLNSKFHSSNLTSYLPLLASFLLAISPWHIQFSRIAFESNVGLAFNIFAILFFLKGLNKPWLLLLSAFFLGTNLYIYQSEKVFTPLLAILLIVVFRKKLFMLPKKSLIASCLLGLVIIYPLANFMFTGKEAFSRAKGVSVFTDETPFVKEYTKRIIEDKKNNDYFGLIVDNRRIAYFKAVLTNYLSHYNLYWLFISGDIARHHAPEMGLLYFWELPFLLIGIYSLIFGNLNIKTKLFIFSWFFIAPIPASVTTGVPHAVRTLNFLPTFQIFIAVGLITTIFSISKTKIRYLIFFVYILFFIFNFSYYLDQYFVQQNYYYSQAWQYGYKEAVAEVKKIEDSYEKIVVSNKPHLDQSYMFFLFYLKYPPNLYQKESRMNASGGFAEDHKFGKFEFRPILWDDEVKNNILYVGRPQDFPAGAKVLKTIFFLDKSEAIKVVEG